MTTTSGTTIARGACSNKNNFRYNNNNIAAAAATNTTARRIISTTTTRTSEKAIIEKNSSSAGAASTTGTATKIEGGNAAAATTTTTEITTTASAEKFDWRKFMNTKRQIFQQDLSLSQLVGRASFLFSIIAWAEDDMLMLRYLALMSALFSLGFQFITNPRLPKIPIHWGMYLLGVKLYMAGSLYMEQSRAEYFGEELEQIYKEGKFGSRGFGRLEFLKFFVGTGGGGTTTDSFSSKGDCHAAKKVFLEEGEIMILQGEVNKKLFYIAEGTAEILKCPISPNKIVHSVKIGKTGGMKSETLGQHIATVDVHHFVGEMSLIDALDQNSLSIGPPSVSVVAGKGGCLVYEWKLLELRKFMWKNRYVTNALQAYVCQDLCQKLVNQHKQNHGRSRVSTAIEVKSLLKQDLDD